jgi:hypothetical protein
MKIYPVHLWTGKGVRTLYKGEAKVGRVHVSVLANSFEDAITRMFKEITRPAGF